MAFVIQCCYFIIICSIHPYLFFNQSSDGTITFVGFKVTPQGNLVHPVNGSVLEANIMSSNLFTGLQRNGVNFSEDYTQWGKSAMIQSLCAVMGVKIRDPDTSYVLTMDNIIKILAIYMRFRYILHDFMHATSYC